MTTDQDHVATSLASARAALERVEALSAVLTDVQWTRGRRPATAQDVGTRQRGGKPDPTGDTATDVPRLGVRSALKATARDLDSVVVALGTLERRMASALRSWEGDK